MINVAKLGYAELTTPDVGRMVAHYEEVLGLAVAATDNGTTYLSTGLDHHAIVLKPGSAPTLDAVAYHLDPAATPGDVVAALEQHGVTARISTDPQPGIATAIDFTDPENNAITLVLADPSVGAPAIRRVGVTPDKLGHVARQVGDAKTIAAFYEDVLGFRWSDWVGDFFVFLRCNADHHSANFVNSPFPGALHHLGFQVRGWAHVKDCCDLLYRHGIPLVWGPGRHAAGHDIFAYYRDPDGSFVELFCELDLMLDESLGYFDPRPYHEDRPQRPKVWDPPTADNVWGIHVPDEMMGK